MMCPRCQQDNPSHAKFCLACGGPLGAAVVADPSYAQLQAENEELRRSRDTAIEQQTATSEILRVISGAPADLQPVFDTIVRSATRLCGGNFGLVLRFDGTLLHLAAHCNVPSEGVQALHRLFPRPLDEASLSARVLRDRRTYQLADVQADAATPAVVSRMSQLIDYRSEIVVPMLRGSTAIGTLSIARSVGGLFPDEQVELLQTFADQAVIAIENVRLFKELEARNRDLSATSEILQVISRSPTSVQPVFEAIAESAARLCEAADVSVWFRQDGDTIRLAARHGSTIPTGRVGEFTLPIDRGTSPGRAVLEGRTIHVRDMQTEIDEFPEGSQFARQFGYRTSLSVPLMREGVPLGAIHLRRTEVQLFSERQIALLQTFADQAVIAIENVRLFTELQEKNSALTEALEQQTATSEILRTIAHTQTDVQPVFDTMVRNAAQLCHATIAGIFLTDGRMVYHPANYGSSS